ncbi:MAG: Ig-like domain-containing protein, partial [Methanomassiliicoccales archaeon]
MKRWALAAVLILVAAATATVVFPADATSGGEGNQNLQSNACTSHNVQGSNTVTLSTSKTSPAAGEQITVTATVSGSQGTADKMGVMLTAAASGTSGTLPADKGWTMVTDPAGSKYNYIEKSGYSGSMTFTWTMKAPATAGSYTLYAKAFYGSQRYIKVSSVLTLTVSAAAVSPPTISITSPANGATVSGTISASVTATPAAGQTISSVDLKIDGTSLGTRTASPYTWSINTASYSNAAHTLLATATDNGARSASQQISVTVNNVIANPTVSITAPSSGATVTGDVTMSASVTAQATVVSVEFKVDSTIIGTDTTAPYSFILNTNTLSKGTHTLTITATDANAKTGTASRSFTVNNDPTTVSFMTPSNGGGVSGTVSVSASATAASGRTIQSVSLSIDGVGQGIDAAAPYAWSVNTLTLSNGAHQLLLTALDSGGATATALISVTVNNQGIAVAFTAPSSDQSLSGTVSVLASASSGAALSTVVLKLDGLVLGTRTAAPFTWSLDTSAYADGSHALNLTATDSLGRVAYAQIQVTFSNSGPQVAITSPADGASVSGTVSVSATATSTRVVSYVIFLLDGTVVGNKTAAPYTWTFSTGAMSDGTHSIIIRAVDNTARVGQHSIQVTVQNPPPTIGIISLRDGAIVKGTVTVSGNAASAQGIAFVEFYVDGVKLGNKTAAPYTWSLVTTTLNDGQHLIELKARSLLGLSASAQLTVIVQNAVIPVEVPTIAISAPMPGQSLQGIFTLTANITSNDPLLFITLRIDDALFDMRSGPPYSWDIDSNLLSDGQHMLVVTAVTTNGGMGVKSVGVTVSNPAPVLSIRGVQEGAPLSGAVSLDLTATSSNRIGEMYIWLDGGLLGLFDSESGKVTLDTNTLSNGQHFLNAAAKDRYGKEGVLQIVFQVRNDAPTVSIISPVEGSREHGPLDIQIEVICLRPVQVSIKIDDVVLGSTGDPPYRFRIDSSLLNNAAHVIVAVATDAYGKSGQAQVTVIVDNAPPSVTLPGIADGATISGQVILAPDVSAPNGVQSLMLKVDGVEAYRATQAPYQYTLDTNLLTNGVHLIALELVDLNGKGCALNVAFAAANPPPTVALQSGAAAFYGPVEMNATILGGSSPIRAWAEVDGAYLTTLSAQGGFTLDTRQLSDGPHRLNVTAEDAYGRQGHAGIAIVVANNGPMVSILTPTANGEIITNSTVTLQIMGPWPTATVEAWVDGNLLGTLSAEPWTFPMDISALAEGTHLLKVSATNSHGAVGNATISFASRMVLPQLELGEPTGSSGSVDVPLNVNVPLLYVVYYLDGVELVNSSDAPFTCTIETGAYADGLHVLNATAMLNDGSTMQLSKGIQFLNSAKVS